MSRGGKTAQARHADNRKHKASIRFSGDYVLDITAEPRAPALAPPPGDIGTDTVVGIDFGRLALIIRSTSLRTARHGCLELGNYINYLLQ